MKKWKENFLYPEELNSKFLVLGKLMTDVGLKLNDESAENNEFLSALNEYLVAIMTQIYQYFCTCI